MRSSRPPHGNTSSGGPFDTLVGLFDRSRDRHASAPLLGEKRDGQWHWITYREVGERVDAFRGGLKAAGVTAGDRVALISDNRIEWAVTAYACFGLGAALVPMYEAQSTDDWAFITKDCGAKMLVCANQSIFDRCAGLTSDIDGVKQRIGLELPASQPNAYARLLAKGRDEPTESIELDPNDTACIMYTSGTTGAPKGVVLSHRNICSNVHALVDAIPLSSADRSLSLLPWAHAFGQTCELHTMIALGASMALAESNARVRANLEEVKPTVLVSVPRIFNRIYAIVNRQMNLRPALTRSTFETAMQLKRAQRERELTLPERVAVEAADRLVLSTVRARFGGRLRCAFSGGAALDNEVAEFMEDLGITVYDGYGLTEASSVVSINTPEARRIGSVGKPLAGVRIEVDTAESDHPDDGEIVVFGPNVMKGYHGHRSGKNRGVGDDGGLRTGDIGHVDDDGYLFITGRLTEQYRLRDGHFVVPAPLEERLKLSPYVTNIMMYGEGHDYTVALVVVCLDALHRWADERQLTFKSTAELLASPRVKSHIAADLGERSTGFRPHERVRDLMMIDENFTTANGMLTPTLKIRRDSVLNRFGDQLGALYDSGSRAAPRRV